jgi:predicted nucleotidyltransferase
LLLRPFGPRQVLAEELEGAEGIDGAYLFGSWAARYPEEVGRPPADLDVLVIGGMSWETGSYLGHTWMRRLWRLW